VGRRVGCSEKTTVTVLSVTCSCTMVYLRNVFSKPLAGMWTGQPLPVQTMASMQLGNMASSKNNAATCCYNLQFETSTKAGAMKQQIEEAGPGCE
jgi:hypothetical protein